MNENPEIFRKLFVKGLGIRSEEEGKGGVLDESQVLSWARRWIFCILREGEMEWGGMG